MMDVGKFHHLLIHQINNVYNLWRFNEYYAVLFQNHFQFSLFCRKIRFVAIYALLRGEKLSQELCLWRKKDNYHVCTVDRTHSLSLFSGHTLALRKAKVTINGLYVLSKYRKKVICSMLTHSVHQFLFIICWNQKQV